MSNATARWSLPVLLAMSSACSDDGAPGASTDVGGTGTTDMATTQVTPNTAAASTTGDSATGDSATGDSATGDNATEGKVDSTTSDSTTSDSTTSDSTGDSSGDATTGECPNDCDDGIGCTDDDCIDGVCINAPVDSLCDDRLDCTTDTCDATADCQHEPVDRLCDDGIPCTVDTCDAVAGCGSAPDHTVCDDGVACTANACDLKTGCQYMPDDAMCDDGVMCTTNTCDAVADCQYVPSNALCDDGNACTDDVCDAALDCGNTAAVLVYNGSGGASTALEDAVTGLGYTPIITTDEASFDAVYDMGDFTAVVIDNPSTFTTVPVGMRTRLQDWVNGGGYLVFGFWNLDADPAMQTVLEVSVSVSVDAPLPIHPDPASPIDLFNSVETFPAPLIYADVWNDNGDQLSPAGGGFIAARFTDALAGPGAIVVSRGDRVLTNGFMITEVGEVGGTDADADMVLDGEELLRNELAYLCTGP